MRAKSLLTRAVAKPAPGMVHLGPGAFFRAFNAVYTHEVMQKQQGDWGIIAISLRSHTARNQLTPQDSVYTSVTLGPMENTDVQIESIVDVLVAPDDPAVAVAAMADPSTSIVSLTITEKGYCHQPSTGRLNMAHPDIQHDIANPETPIAAVGLIAAALQKRRDAGEQGFTVLSCDNLPSNGKVARAVVLDYVKLINADLAEWISQQVSFPSTMVDRITPATTPEDIEQLQHRRGYHDPACVVHEPFRQWVIEDNFVAGRPNWDIVGAQFVRSVDAHETMKLRCLNGVHSALAYLGYLAGYKTIAETVAEPVFAAYCKRLWTDEIIPTVNQPEGEDVNTYCSELLKRFENTAIQHRTWQIAMDGSQKLPQRILATVRDRLEQGKQAKGLCLAVAAWMRYVGGVDEQGQMIDVRDPLAEKLRQACEAATNSTDMVRNILAFEDVISPTLAALPEFRTEILLAYESLQAHGAQEATRRYMKSSVM